MTYLSWRPSASIYKVEVILGNRGVHCSAGFILAHSLPDRRNLRMLLLYQAGYASGMGNTERMVCQATKGLCSCVVPRLGIHLTAFLMPMSPVFGIWAAWDSPLVCSMGFGQA